MPGNCQNKRSYAPETAHSEVGDPIPAGTLVIECSFTACRVAIGIGVLRLQRICLSNQMFLSNKTHELFRKALIGAKVATRRIFAHNNNINVSDLNHVRNILGSRLLFNRNC